MKWISLYILLFATSVIATEDLMSWDFEVIQIDGTVHKGRVYLNRVGDLVGTLYDEDNAEFVQAYGWPTDEMEEMIGFNIQYIEL